MKIIRQNGWIKLVEDNGSYVEGICLDFPKRDMRQQVKEHIESQGRYIKTLQDRIDLIKKVFDAEKPV